MTKNGTKLLFGALTLIFNVAIYPVSAADVTFDPDKVFSSTGNTFTLNIVGRDFLENVDGGGVNLTFDPNTLQINSIFIDETVWDFYVDKGVIDNNAGTVTGIVVNAFSAVGPGDFVIATIDYTVLGEGCTDLTLSEYTMNPFANEGSLINPSFTPGFVNAKLIAGDLNGDCHVDAADILIITQIILNQVIPTKHQQQAGDVAPVDGNIAIPNGVIDVGDLVAIQRKALGLVNFEFMN